MIFSKATFATKTLQSYLGIMDADEEVRDGTGADDEMRDTGDDEAAAHGEDEEAAERGRTVTRLTDPRALRAYAHPVRMALVGLLRTEGPLTATRAAELLGESSGTCSFHLRQLAKYGLVEEAGGGTGREKPWRATTTSTAWDRVTDTPEMAAATGLLQTVIAEEYFAQLMRWLEASSEEPREWQEAVQLGDRILWVTADELAALGREVRELVDEYFERQVRPELRPPGARLVTWLDIAFPNDFRARER
jgi:predicted transcriptional regulator